MGGQPTIQHIDNRWFVKLSEAAGPFSFARSFGRFFGTMGLYGASISQKQVVARIGGKRDRRGARDCGP